MAAALEIRGQAASPGRAIGPAHVAEDRVDEFRPHVSPLIETANLEAAVSKAVSDLAAIAGRSDPESAAILDFQIEMLLDREIMAPALAAIAGGEGAAMAWSSGLDGYIAEIEGADDLQLAARAVDVIDLKNRVLAALDGRPVADFAEGSIFVGKDMAPSLFLAHDWSRGGGIALTSGSIFSHVALLARTRQVPMVVGLGPLGSVGGEMLMVDGESGALVLNPAEDVALVEAKSSSGSPVDVVVPTQPIADEASAAVRLWLNVSDAADLVAIDPEGLSGIGLVRTEFLLATPADALNEERHLDWYRRVLAAAGGRPITIRMIDLGGDKAMPGLDVGETSSFLGLRGIRLLLARPEIARVQARALLRAAAEGDVRVLLPMVTVPDELARMRAIFHEEAAHLERRGIAGRMPPIGIMVEVPSAALMLDQFAEADFFSCGTNDLAQYLAGAARDIPSVASLHEATRPALYRLLRQAVKMAQAMDKSISICGDLAGDPLQTRELIDLGFRDLSMAPGRLLAVRAALSGHSPQAGH